MSESANLDLSRFIILEEIGEGAYGTVYKVKDRSTGKIYAAKRFRIHDDERRETDETLEAYVTREVNNLAGIIHTCIIKFVGYSPIDFDGQPNPVIVTEYMQNQSLAHILDEERHSTALKGWDMTKKLIMIYGIASGMKYLHKFNIIHRDLKPGNILVDELLFPKIADFGLSKREHSSESQTPQSGAYQKGTLRWMAPETDDESYTKYEKPVDVYAFGMIVYEIMTLNLPFHDIKNDFQAFMAVLDGRRPEFNVPVGEAYRNLIERCWDHDPSKRPTFEQIVYELESNSDFITEDIEVEDFIDYQEYVKDEDVNKSFQKIKVRQPKTVQIDENPNTAIMTPEKKRRLEDLNNEYGMRYIPVSFPLDMTVFQEKKPSESILIYKNKGAYYDSQRWGEIFKGRSSYPEFEDYIEKYERILNS